MIANTDSFAATSKTLLATVETATRNSFESTERLIALNLNTTRAALEDGSAAVRALLAVKTPDEFFALQASLARPAAEKALAYFSSSYEILAQSVEEAVKPIETQFAEAAKAVGAALEKAAKSAPAGSEVAVAAVQSAIAAANSAYDSVNKATRKVVQITESNVAATAKAAVDAVSAPVATKTASKKSA
ncbi:phasin family protein [Aromatoleum diolicum]|uniref:TIGR01841 family phasin n=1 Tax=Aromatoleum diolicum TaxID=75796 RepID=A0ABX1QBL0_9RHOO|nr:phasin family protein [Aromatoleum diolicum]NMG75784.1 TIGR01841 family phasin [Aromatoleum diolicum]